MKDWQLAQLNIATLLAPIDSPTLADFVAALDRINDLAEQSPGFVWRLQSDEGNATNLEHGFGDDVIANASVWESVESLHNYVYRTAHAEIISRRKQWFTLMRDAYTVLWWVPCGHRPTLQEAESRLDLLRTRGPTAEAFTFKKAFPAPSDRQQTETRTFDDECPAV
ncbi:DUF3291 domain-containing protein [Granulosicoccus sp. 3-233]|uniref:DUF3291 domain-containing protein n=1 Tax=Granulosicoccus sp. 3-233 TaxID=3417969 RepID=UPI003D344F7B